MKKTVFLLALFLTSFFFLYTSCQKKSNGVKMILTIETSPKEMLQMLCSAPELPEFIQSEKMTDSLNSSSSLPYIELFVQNWDKNYPETPISHYFIDYRGNDIKVLLDFLNSEYDKKINETKSILKKRLEHYGIEEFLFKDTPTKGIFSIEITGVEKPEEIKQLMTNRCRVEFFETYDNTEIFDMLIQTDKIIFDSFPTQTEALNSEDETNQSLLNNNEIEDENPIIAQDSMVKTYPFTSFLNLNMHQDDKGVTIIEKGPVAGYCLVDDTAKVNRMVDFLFTQKYPIFPRDLYFVWTAKPENESTGFLSLIAIKKRHGEAAMDGQSIADASVSKNNGMPEIGLDLTPNGAQIFRNLTRENIGKAIAIVIDGKVFSYPTVMSEISGGKCIISGYFTKEEVNILATMIKSGSIPLEIKIINEEIVKGK
jgi:SecD/SecF fusion protein